MAKSKINTILDGITLAINERYPESMIFSDFVAQGLEPKSFIVTLISSQMQAQPSQAYKRYPRFKVSYFPQNGREECYDVSDELYDVLEVIELADGKKLRGTDMSAEIVDGVLHVFVSYNHIIFAPNDNATMDELDIEQGENYE